MNNPFLLFYSTKPHRQFTVFECIEIVLLKSKL